MSEMIKPTVHMNGTSAADLYHLYADAAMEVGDAIRVVENSAPNGRDYYPQGDEALKRAVQEHQARVAKLRVVMDDLQELAGHCAQFVKEP